MQYFVNALYCMYRQQSGVVTLILRSASVAAYFLFCGKRFAFHFICWIAWTVVFKLPEIEVLSHLVLHSCVAGVGLCGEIGFDVIAFIVWENLLCRVYFSHSTRLSAHLLICISFADEIMFFFLPVTNQTFLSIQCDTSCLFLGCFCVCSDVTDVGTYGRNIVLLWSLISSSNCFTLTEMQRSMVTVFKVCCDLTSHSFSNPGIFSVLPFLWSEEWAGIPPIICSVTQLYRYLSVLSLVFFSNKSSLFLPPHFKIPYISVLRTVKLRHFIFYHQNVMLALLPCTAKPGAGGATEKQAVQPIGWPQCATWHLTWQKL